MKKYLQGFTIVELLVVIIVIGILATVTLVAYNGISNQAREATYKSDRAQAVKQIEAFNAEKGYYPTANVCPNPGPTEICLKTSPGNTFIYTASPATNPTSYTLNRGGGGGAGGTQPYVVSSIPVGSSPEDIAITPDGSKAFVGNRDSSNVTVINTSTNSVITTVPVGSYVQDITITPNGTKAFVANAGSNSVSIINTSTYAVSTVNVGGWPQHIGITPDGSKALVVNGGGSVSILRTSDNALLNTITWPTGGSNPTNVAINSSGTRGYVPNTNGNSQGISVIDITNNSLNTTILPAKANLMWTALTNDGSKLYVAAPYGNSGGNAVAILNTSTNSLTSTLALGAGDANYVTVTPDGSKAYVTNSGGTISVINTGNDTLASTITAASVASPISANLVGPATFSQDGSKAYLAVQLSNFSNFNDPSSWYQDGKVAIVDVSTSSVLATLTVGKRPSDVAVTPDGSKAYVVNTGSNSVTVIGYQ